MIKVIFTSLAGIAFLGTGFFATYFFLTSLDTGGNPWLLVLSFVLAGIGIFLLLRAGTSDDTVIYKTKLSHDSGETKENIIERNNAFSAEWSKSVEKRDRMKVLKMAVGATEKKDPNSA